MIFLIFATLCSASIALVFKFSEGRKLNRYAVTSVNYMAAILVSIIMVLADNTGFSTWRAGLAVGVPAGVCFFLAFVYYQLSVRDSGAGLAGMFGKLGIFNAHDPIADFMERVSHCDSRCGHTTGYLCHIGCKF